MLKKVYGSAVFGVEHIMDVINFFDKNKMLTPTHFDIKQEFESALLKPEFDFADVKGQECIKRCMEIAAAGGHNIILIGPPAKRLPSILPPMTLQEALETTKMGDCVPHQD